MKHFSSVTLISLKSTVSCIDYYFFCSQSVFHFSVWVSEPFFKQRAGVGAESFAFEEIGIRFVLLRNGSISQTNARHSR